MEDKDREQAFLTALTTEHFVLQTFASSTISEGGSRSSIYLLSVSTSLVALGFATGDGGAFGTMAAVVIPTLVVLGWFTIVRLTDTSIENVRCLRQIARIRRHYGTLTEQAHEYFPTTGNTEADAESMLGVRYRRTTLLYTMASMIGVVNAVLAGAGLALLLYLGLGMARPGAVVLGAALAVLLFLATVLYQGRRFASSLTPDE